MENSYFETVVKEAISDLKTNKVAYVFSDEQVKSLIEKIDFDVKVVNEDGIFKILEESVTTCIIQFKNECGMKMVDIKATEKVEDEENIFYYGLSRKELKRLCKSGKYIDKEWKIISVY